VPWHPGPNGTRRILLFAELHGHRLSVRRVSATYWRVCLDGSALGCWIGRDRAMAAAEEAARAGKVLIFLLVVNSPFATFVIAALIRKIEAPYGFKTVRFISHFNCNRRSCFRFA
jgi:hypothetical protein